MYIRRQFKAGERTTRKVDGTLPGVHTERGIDPIATSQTGNFHILWGTGEKGLTLVMRNN